MRLLGRFVVLAAIGLTAACMRPADIAEEKAALMAADHEWSESLREDVDTFLSYLTADATIHMTGLPPLDNPEAIRKEISSRAEASGYSAQWKASEVQVSASADLGYTVGAYTVSRTNVAGNAIPETGKYVAIWRKQSGQWKIAELISNADTPPPSASLPHVIVDGRALTWNPSDSMPPGARIAHLAGDPAMTGAVTVRVQFPAGYRLPPHRHPNDEHLTVLSGTIAVGMGDTFNEAALKDVPAGGYIVFPATDSHYVLSRTAATVQSISMGPLGVAYANASDDPRRGR